MAFEIYYTSSQQGLRQGDRGFCTVAATEGIPRPLWDRLEALSGYRHHFDANTPGRNPVGYAHWVLQLSGHDYHVLSRVCDAGLDYTQRTNSFAHHLVLEPNELTTGGPAWMVDQPGVMVDRWDGQVGPIVRRSPLPRGDTGAGSSSTWQQLAGDAGWAGAVAQAMLTTPWKPVGLLFSPEQSVLPLVAEMTALLPAAVRWQVTFNTYFTSLPGGMTCQWRCCVAGTPAAATLRSATANGLLLDLTKPGSLGAPPDSPWVDAARSGRPMPSATKAAPQTFPAQQKAVPPIAKPSFTPPHTEAPVIPLKTTETPPPRQSKEVLVVHRSGFVGTQARSDLDRSTPVPEFSWMAERRKARRNRLMAIYGLAVVVIVAGAWMSFWAYHASSERPVVIAPTSQPIAIVAPPPPASVEPATAPVVVAPSVVPATAPIPETVIAPLVATPPPAPVAIAPPAPPVTILLDAAPSPGAGKGLRNVVGSLDIPAGKMDRPEAIESISIAFPDGAKQWQFKQGDLDGIFATKSEGRAQRPRFALSWRDSSGMGADSLVATIALDKKRTQLDVTWNNATLLRSPLVSNLAFWVLQNSTIILSDETGQRTQRMTFTPMRFKSTSLSDPDIASILPDNLPVQPHLAIATSHPEGWTIGASTADDAKKEGDEQVLRVEKPPGSAGIVPGFALRYSWSHQSLKSDFAKTVDAARGELQTHQSDTQRARDEIQQMRDGFQPGIAAIQQNIKDAMAAKDLSAKSPQAGDLTQDQFQAEIDKLNKDLQGQSASLEAALADPLAKQKDADERVAAINSALTAYGELKELELQIELPQGLSVGSIRLTQGQQ